jgi:hypothetical protein
VSFGDTGSYQRLVGKVSFAIDPEEKELPFVADLDLAPRNAEGLVEFAADLDIIAPADSSKGNGAILFEFSNRGNRGAFRYNDGGGRDPSVPGYSANGFLMRRGYTVVWCGWQGDLVPNGNNLVAYLPEARENGGPVRGRVRQEFISESIGDPILSLPVSGAENIESYPVISKDTATLTMRHYEPDARQPVPASEWDLAKASGSNGSFQLTPSNVDLYVKGGFKPGWIYELIYDTEGSRVMNLGMMGVREVISFLKYGTADNDGTPNPLAGAIDRAIMYGSSLSARVVREFIYEGWNRDSEGRKVFDGAQTHTGSGRLFMNHRFAQVGRFPRQHEEHSWASERYPFSYLPIPDPFTEKNEGLFRHPDTDPLYMHSHTSGEYWNRHGSLGHTDLRTGESIEIPDTVRMYFVTGTPHLTPPLNPNFIGANVPSNNSPAPVLRACLDLLDEWITKGTPPPANLLPKQEDGTLVRPQDVIEKWPKIPNAKGPGGYSKLPYYDYGPDFDHGLLTTLPPLAKGGQEYPIQVAAIDEDGNELSGLRYPDIEVPIGTWTGWNPRRAGFAEGELFRIAGSFLPFARTRVEREANGDPRASIEERYGTHETYVIRVKTVADGLVRRRLLLTEDAERFVQAAKDNNPLDPSVRLGPLLPAGGRGSGD